MPPQLSLSSLLLGCSQAMVWHVMLTPVTLAPETVPLPLVMVTTWPLGGVSTVTA